MYESLEELPLNLSHQRHLLHHHQHQRNAHHHRNQKQIIKVLRDHIKRLFWRPPNQKQIRPIRKYKQIRLEVCWIEFEIFKARELKIVAQERGGDDW